MPAGGLDSPAGGPQPRLVVVRQVHEVRLLLALANTDIPVLVVLRLDPPGRRRALDLLAGWVLGSGGSADQVSEQVVVLRSTGAPQLHLRRHGLVSAVETALRAAAPCGLTLPEEDRLRSRAQSGSAEACRRLVDAYTELATSIALWLRPERLPVGLAIRWAHSELDAIVAGGPGRPILVDLVARLARRFDC